jgi:hypothetical protein
VNYDTDKAEIKKLTDITVTWDQATTVLITKTLPKYEARLQSSLPNLDKLPAESHGALISFVRVFGSNFTGGEEKGKIHELMAKEQFSGIPDQIRALGLRHSREMGGTRDSDAIAALFEKDLGTSVVAPTAASTPTLPSSSAPPQ